LGSYESTDSKTEEEDTPLQESAQDELLNSEVELKTYYEDYEKSL
jgi:hypothetical protein